MNKTEIKPLTGVWVIVDKEGDVATDLMAATPEEAKQHLYSLFSWNWKGLEGFGYRCIQVNISFTEL